MLLLSLRVTVDSGLRDAGFEYINLDAGVWSPNRTASGEMQADPAKFPSGIKSLADKLHAKNLKLGVYVAHAARQSSPNSAPVLSCLFSGFGRS